MEELMAFLQDRWFVVLIAIVAIFFVFKLAKTVIKWVVIIAILVALYVYGWSYVESLNLF